MGKHFESIDPYDKAAGDVFIRTEHLARYLFAAEFMGRRKLRRVLDAACGDGYGARLLARRAESVLGLEREKGSIERGTSPNARNAAPNAALRAADLDEGLPMLEDGAFDCAVCFETLEHVKDDAGLLGEFARVLRRGGYLLLSVPKAGYEPAGPGGMPVNPYHLRLYEDAELRELLSGCGFLVERALGQPYSNAARVRMEDYIRDTGASRYEVAGYFNETPRSLEFFAKLWAWPVEEFPEKSNTLVFICRRV
jgi:SAM-dependent methyltransferase